MTTTLTESHALVATMAERFQLSPAEFTKTCKAICFPDGKATDEQFFAFLAIARMYDLNPFAHEIYAMTRPNNGIQVIVGVDGWLKLINSHPQFDGMEFTDKVEGGRLLAITCRIYRKDRRHPVECTEYMKECMRQTEPWQKWPGRMLRHKALNQTARYAFNFAGIIDPDESQRLEAIDVTTGEITGSGGIADASGHAAEAPRTPVVATDKTSIAGSSPASPTITTTGAGGGRSTEEDSSAVSARLQSPITPEVVEPEPKPDALKRNDLAPPEMLRDFFDSVKRKFNVEDAQAKLMATGWMHETGQKSAKRLTIAQLESMMALMMNAEAPEQAEPF